MNKTTTIAGILFGLMQFGAAISAFADVTVTFAGSGVTPTNAAFVREGFSFATSGTHAVNTTNSYGADNGTNYLVYLALGNFETFSAVGNTPFNLNKIDLAGWWNFGTAAQTLTITGHKANGNEVTAQVSVSPTSFDTFEGSTFSDFTNLQWVKLGALSRGYVAVDNIVTTPVPEPGTYAMFLAGLGLMAGIARRRRAS